MCIRDRHPVMTGNTFVGTPVDGAWSGSPLEMHDNIFFGSPCLLYTSDAADERSSVDLGGRRIIKKKKT